MLWCSWTSSRVRIYNSSSGAGWFWICGLHLWQNSLVWFRRWSWNTVVSTWRKAQLFWLPWLSDRSFDLRRYAPHGAFSWACSWPRLWHSVAARRFCSGCDLCKLAILCGMPSTGKPSVTIAANGPEYLYVVFYVMFVQWLNFDYFIWLLIWFLYTVCSCCPHPLQKLPCDGTLQNPSTFTPGVLQLQPHLLGIGQQWTMLVPILVDPCGVLLGSMEKAKSPPGSGCLVDSQPAVLMKSRGRRSSCRHVKFMNYMTIIYVYDLYCFINL